MMYSEIIEWLMRGDVSIQYQVNRDLLGKKKPVLQKRIATEGWGLKYLQERNAEGYWGDGYYFPKWKATHYTLLDLRNLYIPQNNKLIRTTIKQIIPDYKGADGGISCSRTLTPSDVCVNGMFLNFASYFKIAEKPLRSVVDFLLHEHMPDGGFNCRSNRSGAVHSSFHSTISVLEGISNYEKNGYNYRIEELIHAKEAAIEFLLIHQLFLSDKTGRIINKDFLKIPYPTRWRYNFLRVLDYLRYEGISWDDRLIPALDLLLEKRNKKNTWNVQAKWPGKIHFEMEKAGKPSRQNTLIALRVLNHFKRLDD